jgi:hypothetical protein
MPRERKLNNADWETEQLDRIVKFLHLLYTDLRHAAKTPMVVQKLKVTGLGQVYWDAVRKLGVLRLSGAKKSLIGYWGNPAPDYELAQKVLAQVRLIWANNKQRERDHDAAGVSKRKLIPIVVRKKHNPGTIFISLTQVYVAQPANGYTQMELAERAIKYELPENLFESVAQLDFITVGEDGRYKFTSEPTQELADILFEEHFSRRKRSRAEVYNDISNCLTKLWNVFKGKDLPVDSSAVNEVLASMKFNSKFERIIRQGCLERVPNDTGQKGVVRYRWTAGDSAPDLDLAIRIYHSGEKTDKGENADKGENTLTADKTSLQSNTQPRVREGDKVYSVDEWNKKVEANTLRETLAKQQSMDVAENLRAKLVELGEAESRLTATLAKIQADKSACEKVLAMYSS